MGSPSSKPRGWHRMPENVKVRAIDVERVLTGQGHSLGEAMRIVRGRGVVWGDASARTFYEYRAP